jgi:fatty-acyl-CoA synthase
MSYWPASDEVPTLRATVGDLLRRTAEADPDRMAVVDGTPSSTRSWTYREFLDVACRCAGSLVEQFGTGKRIGLWAANCPEWLILQQAAALAGAQLVAINPAYKYPELEYVLRDSGCVALFHGDEHRCSDLRSMAERAVGELAELTTSVGLPEWIAESYADTGTVALPDVTEEDVAVVQYTSGTTAAPKGVLVSHFSMVNSAHFVARRSGIERGCVYVNPMPTFHIGSCGTVTLGTVSSAGTQVIVPGFEPSRVLELVEQHRATALLAVPTMLIAMLENADSGERDLSSLELVLTGGATASADLVRRVKAVFGCEFSIVFGQTETGGPSTQTDPNGQVWEQSETVGRALPHTEIEIADPVTGETLPLGGQGEICSRGPTTMLGYLHRPDDQSLRPDGWMHYGDLGTIDADGYLRVTGRLKDMIVRGGENISPREIEEVLCTHPLVLDAVVVAAPDEKWGEQVAAFVRVEHAGINEQQLSEYCSARLARHKVPRIWRWVTSFPLTASGKIQKFKLREELAC